MYMMFRASMVKMVSLNLGCLSLILIDLSQGLAVHNVQASQESAPERFLVCPAKMQRHIAIENQQLVSLPVIKRKAD